MDIFFATPEQFEQYIPQFSALHKQSFHQEMTEKEIRWRYLDNPRQDILACFAVDEGRLVANYSASPVHLIWDGNPIKSAQSLNTMTHPDYMGRGLFVELASRLYHSMAENGYRLIFGFPNYISNRTFLTRLAWNDIYEVPTLTLDLHQYKRVTIPSEVLTDDGFLLDHSDCVYTEGIAVNKDPSYMKWRFADHPTYQYHTFVICDGEDHVAARMVWKEYGERINIVSIFAPDLTAEELLLRACIARAQQLEKHFVTLWRQFGTPSHLLYEKYGFCNQTPITYFGGSIFSGEEGSFYKYDSWHLDMSDDNVY